MAKVKILVVEDEAITAMDLQNRLRGLGYDAPAIASSGEGAIKKAEEIKPDLVLMDIILKGDMDGIEAAELIHDRFDIPVVYVTAYLDEERLQKTKASAPYGYIIKPFGDNDLRPLIEMALQRHTLEKALRESEEKYRSLVTNLPDVTWTTDNEGNTTFVSPNIEKVYGYTSEEICKAGDRLWFGRIYPDDVEKVNEAYKVLFEKKEKFDVEYRITRKDGKWIWLHDRAIVTYEKEGVVYADGVFTDITERKRIEDELKAAEEKYRIIFEAAPISVILFDKDGLIMDVNTWHLTNIARGKATKADLIGKSIIAHPSIVNAGLSETYKRVLEGEPFDKKGVYFPTLIPGTSGYFDVKGVPVFKDGEVIGAVALHDDITERKQMEEKRRLFSHAADSSIDGLAMGDLEGKITYVNNAFVRMFGYSREELIGNEIAFIYSEDQLPKLEEALKATMDGGWIGEFVGKRKNGELFPIANSSSLIKDDEGNLIAHMASHQDISERKRAENELKKKNKELELFNRLAVGREIKMIELKKEINALLVQLGKGSKYEIARKS